jgi:hypothetical protein
MARDLVADFLKKHSLADIKAEVVGETLNEYGTKFASYFFGNGELIVCPADESQDETVYVIDTYGDRDFLVEF